MKLRKAISMKEYRRRRRAAGFAGEARRKRIVRRTQNAAPTVEPKKAEWAKPLTLSPSLQVRAKAGTRAVVMPLRPGLFLVGEVADGKVADGAQKVAGAMAKAAQGALGGGAAGRGQPSQGPMPASRQLPAPTEPVAPEPDRDDDFEGLFGCERCGGRCGGAR